MKRLAQRVSGIDTTIFATMSELAIRTGSVNLGQGFPDTDGPDEVREAAVAALRGGRNQYAPGAGVPELRRAVAAHQRRWYGMQVDPDTEVVVTTGATEAVAAALLALVDPGDEVVVLEPYYDSYPAGIALAGGVRRAVALLAPEFRVDLDGLRAAITPRTTAILLNSPHNPTGAVLTEHELAGVARLAVEHDLLVISDEVYEHLVFDGRRHVPIATLPGMAERTLTISSAGKTFSFTGWKVGWAVGPAPLVQAVTKAKQFLTYTSGAPLQPAVAVALGLPDAFYTQVADSLQARRDQLCTGLAGLGLDVRVPEGTYFATTDVRALGVDDGMAFCLDLPHRAGVVAIPHSVFADDPQTGRSLVRWAFCKRPEVLDEALDRLRRVYA
ncbi:MAG: Aspartate aminotransferase [uncultured Nocardioidaceae bacterium]|uniref:Aspartate aminotransferase n=1 Tax=uncultured Nocardioidaceae bacterium TaxID=253824 RepID=A0A6J4KUS9_9ACTN|nr:MAG: Aspartate aminotransferase [uncultured Nocardioidaceae bacterium]